MAFGGSQWEEFMKCFGWYEKIPCDQNNYEDVMKLEPRIFKRTGQDLRENLLRSSNIEIDKEKHTLKNLRDTPEE